MLQSAWRWRMMSRPDEDIKAGVAIEELSEMGGQLRSEYCGLAWLCCPFILNLTQSNIFQIPC